jgi:hypothetical protein
MSHYVYANEEGCFRFERKQNVGKNFIICSVTMDNLDAGYAPPAMRVALSQSALADSAIATRMGLRRELRALQQ